jgi:hypothetical protein
VLAALQVLHPLLVLLLLLRLPHLLKQGQGQVLMQAQVLLLLLLTPLQSPLLRYWQQQLQQQQHPPGCQTLKCAAHPSG